MKSNYKKLSPYIREVSLKNKNIGITHLLGVSISKQFIPSIANIVGTDLSTYKIVKKNQFAYGPVTSRNGDKISIALLEDEECIVSTSYTVFEIVDTELLDPEYLMMWFRRPEFDRYARFMSHGSVREIFGWEELGDIELPVPSIEEQRAIVKEYNTVVDNIKTNEKIIDALESTAGALYKEWFMDFNFPDETGQPYKARGGAMIYNPTLEKEIPEGWDIVSIKEFCKDMKNGATPKRDIPEYWNSNDIPWLKTGEISNNIVIAAEEYISREGYKRSSTKLLPINTVLMAMYGATAAQVGFLKFEASTNQACCAMICENLKKAAFLYFHLLYNQDSIKNMANGGAQENLSKDLIEKLPIINTVIFDFSPFIEQLTSLTKFNSQLAKSADILLSKMSSLGGDK